MAIQLLGYTRTQANALIHSFNSGILVIYSGTRRAPGEMPYRESELIANTMHSAPISDSPSYGDITSYYYREGNCYFDQSHASQTAVIKMPSTSGGREWISSKDATATWFAIYPSPWSGWRDSPHSIISGTVGDINDSGEAAPLLLENKQASIGSTMRIANFEMKLV